METWHWIVIGIFVLGGLSFLSKSTRTVVRADERIRDMRGYIDFYAGFLRQIQSGLHYENLLTPLLEENFNEVNSKLANARGMLSQAEAAMQLYRNSGDTASRKARLEDALRALNTVIAAIPGFDQATTLLLDSLPSHPDVDGLAATFRKKKKNIMTGYSSKPVEYK